MEGYIIKLFICDDMPVFCPYCGVRLRNRAVDSLDRQDYLAKCEHMCLSCHAQYCHMTAQEIVTSAHAAGSDIADYVKP